MSLEVHGVSSDNGDEPEVDVMEIMMNQRVGMQCRQELQRVEQLNKVKRMKRNPTLTRNLLSKIVTGPLGKRSESPEIETTNTPHDSTTNEPRNRLSSEEKRQLEYEQRVARINSMKQSQNEELDTSPKNRRSSEERRQLEYEQRVERLRAMKQSQNEELDNLRSHGIVQKRLLDRRMRWRAHHMFNHRLYVNPNSGQGGTKKSSILVTGEEQDSAPSAEYIRQESQIYIGNFFQTPSKNRRVLQRLNSAQIRRIKNIEIKKSGVKKFQFASLDREVVPEVEKDGVAIKSQEDTSIKLNTHAKKKESKLSYLKKKWTSSLSRKKTQEEKPLSPSKLSNLSRKIKGGITKTGKRKSRLNRHTSSSLDELSYLDDARVKVKPRKKSAERRKLLSTQKQSVKALEDQVTDVSRTKRTLPLAPSSVPTKPAPSQLTSPPGSSVNWPPLSSSGASVSQDMSLQSNDIPFQAAGGPPWPMSPLKQSPVKDSLNDESYSENGSLQENLNEGSSHDDHMIPPTSELRDIEQNDEEGYMSESESGTYSDDEQPKTKYTPRIVADGEASDKNDETNLNEPTVSDEDEDQDFVADLPTSRTKNHSHDIVSPTMDFSRKRHFSSPQISMTPLTSLSFRDGTTPSGYYTTATVEVDPFSLEFEQSLHSKETFEHSETTSTVIRQSSQILAESDESDTPGGLTLEAIETRTQVTCRQSTHSGRHVKQLSDSIEPESGIPRRAFRDPKFVQFIEALDRKPTTNDYIGYKLQKIGDQIDQKYDNQLNQALDDVFWETIKSPSAIKNITSLSYESFSNASKHLLVEGQRIQDSIFLITCFGRRLTEILPNLGDRVNGFTQMMVDAYASDFLFSIGGWGQLVECYGQVETQVDYEDYPDTGYLPAGLYDDPIYSPSSNQASSFDDPLPNHPHIIQVNPPSDCSYATQSFPPPPGLNRLRRVISVEVLFTETESTTEHCFHENQPTRNRSLTRSLSASSIEVSSTQYQHRMVDSNLLTTPSPTKLPSEHFHYEEFNLEEKNFRVSRRGSVTSVCSNASTIRLVNIDHTGGGVVVTNSDLTYLDVPPTGPYLDLHLDTPSHSRSGTLNGGPHKSRTTPSDRTIPEPRSLAIPIVTTLIAVGVVGVLGYYYFKRK